MSHFTVLVIGANIEEQLAPFHQFECTGTNDKYIQDLDVTEESKEEFKKYGNNKEYPTFSRFLENWNSYSCVPFGGTPDIEGFHKYGYYTVDEAGEVAKVINRTNPNYQWDWYVTGGRWSGLLKLKDGKKVDSAIKSTLDLEAMRIERPFSTFAVLKDGQWHERGKMGWWACVSDEMPEEEWQTKFDELVNGLPEDTLLTIVDCHV